MHRDPYVFTASKGGTVGKHTRTPRGTHRREAAFERKERLAKGTLEKLREKAEQRLDAMPEPVQRAIALGESVLGLMLVPIRFGARLVKDVLAVPAAMFRMLTRQEA
jgi:hypothetical protein